ncbi:MAG: S41 family peptidase [Bacteroidales bacterium]|nr:S41 family peptidase [Bacteroidales bacterium]
MSSPKQPATWLPLAIAISIVIGIFFGRNFSGQKYNADFDRKLNMVLNLISDDYVDTMKINDLVELTIPEILKNLDPHTTYFSAEELRQANEDLDGKFSGIGISFMLMNDTINVIEIIPGGPAERAGILAGDRIVSINDSTSTGKNISDIDVKNRIRGLKDSIVKLGIKRKGAKKTLSFNVKRGDIPVNSVDAAYMLDKLTGYIKVSKFARNTYNEFLSSLIKLKSEGAKHYVIDLRGNGGGIMEMAILMANEFLPENQLIVYTKSRDKRNDSQVWSDGNGSFQEAQIVVLLDEFSASASEIFAGAIQDNDRGLIIGCRSFGKGLVQRQFTLPDSSAIRMTIARYYTPSGRSIQKEYKNSQAKYDEELLSRFNNGELYSRDSIKVDKNKLFETTHGRKVYGGGGIVPDIFVARDTTGITSYYAAVANAGLIQKYAYRFTDTNRQKFKKLKDYKQFLRVLPNDEALLMDFVTYATKNGVPARWYYINISRNLLLTQLKALMARDMFGNDAFYPIYNRNDKDIEIALKAINKHKATFPILPTD